MSLAPILIIFFLLFHFNCEANDKIIYDGEMCTMEMKKGQQMKIDSIYKIETSTYFIEKQIGYSGGKYADFFKISEVDMAKCTESGQTDVKMLTMKSEKFLANTYVPEIFGDDLCLIHEKSKPTNKFFLNTFSYKSDNNQFFYIDPVEKQFHLFADAQEAMDKDEKWKSCLTKMGGRKTIIFEDIKAEDVVHPRQRHLGKDANPPIGNKKEENTNGTQGDGKENNKGEGEKGAQESILRLEYPKPEDKPKQEENPNKPEKTSKPVVEETNRKIPEESNKTRTTKKVDKCSTKVVGNTTLNVNHKKKLYKTMGFGRWSPKKAEPSFKELNLAYESAKTWSTNNENEFHYIAKAFELLTNERKLKACKFMDVNFEPTLKEVKKAYKKKAMEYHPDKNRGNTSTETEATENFKAMHIIYDELLELCGWT